jgi:hypothetical protein
MNMGGNMISKYIDNKELKRVIEDGKLKNFHIKKILKDQGIIFTTTNAEQIAEQVYPILWGSCDIEKMSQSIDDSGNYIKSSIIELRTDNSESIMNDLEDFFNNASFRDTRYSMAGISRVNENQLVLKLKYSVIRPGRIEFISTQYKNTEIIVSKTENGKALLDVRQASSAEMKDLNKLLDEAVRKDSTVHVRHISLQILTNENRVAFFDEFIKNKFSGWRFVTVTKVALKKYEGEESEIKELDEEEDMSQTNLQGITSAILSGTSIRNNSFVQECLQNNFYITTMGYKFECMEDLREVVVEINFKYDDLKIDICKTYEYDSDVENLCLHPAMLDVQEEILKMFQKVAYEQYMKIVERQEQEASSK